MQNQLSKWIRGTWVALVLSVVVPLLLQMAGVDPVAIWIIGGVVALCCVIMLPILAHTARKYGRAVQELLAGGYLAHWQYDADEWYGFAEAEWLRTRREVRRLPLEFTGAGLIIGVLGGLFGGEWLGTLLVAGGGGLFIGLVVAPLMYLGGRHLYRRRMQEMGDAYIGSRGVYMGGQYYTWDGMGLSLQQVEVKPGDPPVLQFTIGMHTHQGSSAQEVRVAIPGGHEAEAEELARRFSFTT